MSDTPYRPPQTVVVFPADETSREGQDPVAARLAERLDSPQYPALAREIVATLAESGLARL